MKKSPHRHKRIGVLLSIDNEAKLIKSAKESGRSKLDEAMIRLAHSLKNVNKIEGDYWSISHD